MVLLMRSWSCFRRWWAAASRGRQAAGDWEVGGCVRGSEEEEEVVLVVLEGEEEK